MSKTEATRQAGPGDAALALLVAGLGATLLMAGVAIRGGLDGQWVPRGSLEFPGLMGMVSSVLGLAILTWWAGGLLAAIIGQVLVVRGHAVLGQRFSGWSPGFMRRLVLLILSMNLIAAPAMAGAPTQDVGMVQQVHSGTGTGSSSASQTKHISPVWQVAEQESSEAPGPQWTPRKPGAGSDVLTRGPLRGSETGISDRTITVQPGDNLWSLAAEHLGPYATDVEIALEWPRWYEANKETIGPDAGLLLPGQVLRIPTTSNV